MKHGIGVTRWLLLAALVAMSTPGNAFGQAVLTDAEFDARYRCPESLPAADRKAEVDTYLQWVKARHPDWTISDAVSNRVQLLQAHNCAATLAAIHANTARNNPPSPARFVCTKHGQRSFSQITGAGCHPLPMEEGWDNFTFRPDVVVDVNPGSIMHEAGIVKVWVRFYTADPLEYATAQGISRGNYNNMTGLFRFTCGKRQQMIIQGTYYLDDREIYYRLANEAVTEEIEPDTISDFLYRKYCPR